MSLTGIIGFDNLLPWNALRYYVTQPPLVNLEWEEGDLRSWGRQQPIFEGDYRIEADYALGFQMEWGRREYPGRQFVRLLQTVGVLLKEPYCSRQGAYGMNGQWMLLWRDGICYTHPHDLMWRTALTYFLPTEIVYDKDIWGWRGDASFYAYGCLPELLMLEPELEDYRDYAGCDLVLICARHGDLVGLEFLADLGKRLDRWGYSYRTPLTEAVQGGHEEVIAFLLSRGVDVNGGDEQGMSPLMYAAKYGWYPIVELLLRHGADIHQTNERGETALRLATQEQDRGSQGNHITPPKRYDAIVERLAGL